MSHEEARPRRAFFVAAQRGGLAYPRSGYREEDPQAPRAGASHHGL